MGKCSFNKTKIIKQNNFNIDDSCLLDDCNIDDNCSIKNNCYLKNCIIGKNCVIENGCYLEDCKIDSNVIVKHNCLLKNAKIDNNTTILSSNISDSVIGKETLIGPYARIRENANIGNFVKIGNFVEIKNSSINDETKISHLAYVGDAIVGKKCNIGCGVVFVNYNGKIKQKTIVKDNSFIGCNCNLIAPVTIEQNTYVCAGTTVTSNVEEFDFVIGRNKQENKKGLAKKYLKEIVND